MSVDITRFNTFPELETNRLTLREITKEDAVAILGMREDDRVNQFIPRGPVENIQQVEALIEKTREAFKNGTGLGWAGILKDDGETVIGTCGFNKIDAKNRRAEIGGEMSVDHWGKNYALEAVKKIVCFGFKKMGLHSIEARVAPGNRSAIHLLESLGFEKEGHLREAVYYNGKFLDQNIYSLREHEPNGWDAIEKHEPS